MQRRNILQQVIILANRVQLDSLQVNVEQSIKFDNVSRAAFQQLVYERILDELLRIIIHQLSFDQLVMDDEIQPR